MDIKQVCEKYKEDFSNKKRAYKLIIDGEESYVVGYPPKRVGVRYVSLSHGLVEVKSMRLGFAVLEVVCETVK